MAEIPTTWVGVAGVMMTSGTIKIILDIWREWRGTPSRRQRQVEANIKILSSTRDELAEDNARYRQELIDKDERHRQEMADVLTRHEVERTRWLADQERLRNDIARLEAQIQAERLASAEREREAQQRYDALWETVQSLRRRAESKEE